MPPSIAVVVPVHDSLPEVRRCISSIRRARTRYDGDVRVIAVDNFSTDGSHRYLESELEDRDTVLRSSADNVAAVRNRGADAADAECLAFVDSDTVIPAGYFATAVDVLERTGESATGAMVAVPRSEGRIPYTWYNLQRNPESGIVHYLNSANFFVRARAYAEVGGFDETLDSGEDSDICLRLRERGHRIFECLELTSVHLDNPRSPREFYRQQLWHARGMLSTVRAGEINKPLAGTVLYGTGALAPPLSALAPGPSLSGPVVVGAVLVSTTFVAGLAAAYRMLRARRFTHPLTAVGLFHLYFVSRCHALLGMLWPR